MKGASNVAFWGLSSIKKSNAAMCLTAFIGRDAGNAYVIPQTAGRTLLHTGTHP